MARRISHLVWVLEEAENIVRDIIEIGTGKMTVDQVVEYQNRLAALNFYIGEYAAKAVSKTNFAYANKKFRYADKWSPMKEKLNALGKATDSDVKAALDVKLKDDTDKHIKDQAISDKLSAVWESNQQIINSLASAIKVKLGERATSGMN